VAPYHIRVTKAIGKCNPLIGKIEIAPVNGMSRQRWLLMLESVHAIHVISRKVKYFWLSI